MKTHTPTQAPWYAYEPQKDTGEIIITRDCSYDNRRLVKVLPVSPDEADTIANAAHIVKCVNAHESLLSAMQGAIDALSQNKTFPADIVAAKNLLTNAMQAVGVEVKPLGR